MAYDEELNQRREERRQQQAFRDSQKKLLRIAVIITAVTMVVCVAALGITVAVLGMPSSPSMETPAPSQPETPAPEPEAPPKAPDTVIHLVVGGDVNITDKTVAAGAIPNGYDYTSTFLDVAPILAGADLSALNFEGGLSGAPYGTAQKSAPKELVQGLRNAGVDFLQTANSQSIAAGLDGLKSTLAGINAAGITPLGTYATSEEFQKTGGYVIREVQGIRIAFVAFTKGMDGMGLPAGSEDCVNLLYTDYNSTYQKVDTEGITRVLETVKGQNPDITVALLHWGSEFNSKISKTQEKITTLMLEQGVDAIIGTHSHYVQTAEFNSARGTLVAYSLGDFLGNAESAGTDYSILLDLEITKNGETGKVKLSGVDYVPLYLQDETEDGGNLRILRIREALAAYEQNFVSKVSEQTYLAMKSALGKIESRMKLS